MPKLDIKQPERVAYRVEEFAALTGASVRSIEQMVKSGALRHVKAGATTLIPATEGKKFAGEA